LETYEKILCGVLLIFGMAVTAYFVWAVVKDMRTPVNVKWVWGENNRFEGFVVA
jgi:hypothetical protein